jgi:hypothetical protein
MKARSFGIICRLPDSRETRPGHRREGFQHAHEFPCFHRAGCDRRGDRHGSGPKGRDDLEYLRPADFAVAIILGMATAPSRFQLIVPNLPSINPDTYPNVLTPAFVVPSSILLHALSLRQLRRRGRVVTARR